MAEIILFTDDELEIINEVTKFYNLYRGDNTKAGFRAKSYNAYERDSKNRKIALHIAVNIAGKISKACAEYMFGDGLKILTNEADTDDNIKSFLDDWIEREDFFNKLYNSAITQDWAGYSVFKLYRQDNQAKVEEIPPYSYIPSFNLLDSNNPTSVKIPISFKSENKCYIFIQEYKVGEITNTIYELQPDSITKAKSIVPLAKFFPELNEVENTELNYIPIFRIDNDRIIGEKLGVSSYRSIYDLLEDIDDRVSQVSAQLAKHANPKMVVGEGFLNEKNQMPNTTDVIAINKDDIVPQYLSNNNPLIEYVFKQYEQLIRLVAILSETPTSELGIEEAVNEKVGAMRLRMLSFIKKLVRKRQAYERQLKRIFRSVLEIEGVAIPEGLDFHFEWSEILPSDDTEKLENTIKKVEAGLMSKDRAMRLLDNLNDEEILAEQEKIQTEKSSTATPARTNRVLNRANIFAETTPQVINTNQ